MNIRVSWSGIGFIALTATTVLILAEPFVRLALFSILVVLLLWHVLIPRATLRSLSDAERQVLRAFLILKGAAAVGAYVIGSNAEALFSSGWDSQGYHNRAVQISAELELTGIATSQRSVPGTGAVELSLGHFYRSLGADSLLIVSVAASFVSAVGLVLFWISTREVVRDSWRRWYALILFFAPTTIYWSSGFGKEPLVLLGIGSFVASVALWRRGRKPVRALLYIAVFVLTVGMIRPHIGMVAVGALLLPLLFAHGREIAPVRRAVGLLLGAGVLLALIPLTSSLLNVEEGASLYDAAVDRAEATSEGLGDASYEAQPVNSFGSLPSAVLTTLFRPYLWEARSVFQLLTAAEAAAALVLGVYGLAKGGFSRLYRQRGFWTLYSSGYILAFSSVVVTYGNFGLLARQRMQVWPFMSLLLVLALQEASSNRLPKASPRSTPHDTKSSWTR
ncbi:hypothetical protein [Rhabdothermincola salaria]|uniref:hypothetical protein n=1 Tax=Rhabdothermincola salaria TaxID=2903142 RepID=UPI001E45B1DD|nr:hypothetical protein [Rhabdothermincola salaria]MCD9622753.1 hypothetical protein [Rhabdothermincola salaria]